MNFVHTVSSNFYMILGKICSFFEEY